MGMCQLLVTGAVMALFMYVKPIKSYVQENQWLMFASWGAAFVCIIVLACCGDVRRKSPGNFICLAVFTVCESFMLGTIATFYTTDAVLMAVGTTAAVTLALTLFAFQTKIDFTGCGAALLCILVIFIMSGIFLSIFGVMTGRPTLVTPLWAVSSSRSTSSTTPRSCWAGNTSTPSALRSTSSLPSTSIWTLSTSSFTSCLFLEILPLIECKNVVFKRGG